MLIESAERTQPGRDQHEGGTEKLDRKRRAASWDYSKVPVFAPELQNGHEPSFPLTGPVMACAMQPKLAVGRVGDPLEREADSVADRIMRMPDADVSLTSAPLQLSRTSVTSGHTEPRTSHTEPLRRPEPDASEAAGTVDEVLHAPGEPLDEATRAFMEPRFGYDFSGVRVHTGAAAAESARSVNAVAFTVGRDVVFGEGKYAPGQETGRKLLAHELAHTIHQGKARRSEPRKAIEQFEYDRRPDAFGVAAGLYRRPIQRLTLQSSSLILRQTAQSDQMPAIDRDEPILFTHPLQPDPRSPIQRKLDEFRDRMRASYTVKLAEGAAGPPAAVIVAPPFAMGGKGWPVQQAMDGKFKDHLQNIKKTNPRVAQLADRVRSARGSSEEIRALTQALIDDNALNDITLAGSLEQRIQEMMFEYRIGTDCAGYVQQAYLATAGAGRSAAGLKPDIGLEDLGDLEHQGFTRISPSAALPGDLVVMDSPRKHEVGHTIIVYSRREATADDKKGLKNKLGMAALPSLPILAADAIVYVFEFDSSWGSGGGPTATPGEQARGIMEHGGIQRRTFWYKPKETPRGTSEQWAWTENDPNKAFVGDKPYDHILRGFYRGPSRPASAPSPARP